VPQAVLFALVSSLLLCVGIILGGVLAASRALRRRG
jgi:hypothetical protein